MADSSGKVPIIAVVRQSWGFMAANLRQLAPAAAVCAVLAELGVAANLLVGQGLQVATVSFLALIPTMLSSLMFAAAVLRLAVREESVAPIGLKLGADEGRLFGLNASLLLIALPILFLLSALVIVPVLARVANSPEAMEALAQDPEAMAQALNEALGPVSGILEFAALALISVSIGLVAFLQAGTIGEKRIMLFQALRWLGGNVFRVIAAVALNVVPVLAAAAISGMLLSPLVTNVPTYLLTTTVVNLITNIFMIPVCALGAILYRGLRPAGFAAK